MQAEWTQAIRLHLFARAGVIKARRILEVGCGTGVITDDLGRETRARIYGLDLNPEFLRLARGFDRRTHFIQGDGNALPYPAGTFDLVFCHYLLLWVEDPLPLLVEMKRVAKPGKVVLAAAEPDYGGRIDFPKELAEMGRLQTEGLKRSGANPLIGRELAALFNRAGFKKIETGVLGGEWQHPLPAMDRQSEWSTLEADLGVSIPVAQLEELRDIDQKAWASGERVLFVPTFYAIGWNI